MSKFGKEKQIQIKNYEVIGYFFVNRNHVQYTVFQDLISAGTFRQKFSF